MVRHLGAGIITRQHDHKIFLVHNLKEGFRMEPPGGKIKPGETVQHCVYRETLEETGLVVEVRDYFASYATTSKEGDFIVDMYCAEIIGGNLRFAEKGKIEGGDWYSMADLRRFKENGTLAPNLVGCLDRLSLLVS